MWPPCWGSGGCLAWQRRAGCGCSGDTGAWPPGPFGPRPPAPSAPPQTVGTEMEEGEALMTLQERRVEELIQLHWSEWELLQPLSILRHIKIEITWNKIQLLKVQPHYPLQVSSATAILIFIYTTKNGFLLPVLLADHNHTFTCFVDNRVCA